MKLHHLFPFADYSVVDEMNPVNKQLEFPARIAVLYKLFHFLLYKLFHYLLGQERIDSLPMKSAAVVGARGYCPDFDLLVPYYIHNLSHADE